MNGFIFWLIGWVLLSIGYYVFNVYYGNRFTKKIIAWRAFWTGIFSWAGIIVLFSVGLVTCIITFNDWVEDKLS